VRSRLFATFSIRTLIVFRSALVISVLTSFAVILRGHYIRVLNLLELASAGIDHRLRALPRGLNGCDFGAVRSHLVLRLRVVNDHVDALPPQGP